jgi:hypothetical protein
VTWHHPNYYKKLRAERKKIPVSGTKERETAPSEKYCCSQLEEWEKAPSLKLPKSQAASGKLQAPSCKRQASSRKRQAP